MSDDKSARQPAGGHPLNALIGDSAAFVRVIARVRAVAASDATVLVEGETGTGKELVARAIHYLGSRASQPFVPVNCGAIPDPLIEDELFGHERGAFTDARHDRPGLIAAAGGGTLCLDEISSLSQRGQVVMLRLLQDGSYRCVGSTQELRASARIVALTNTPLPVLVERGLFRPDLFYRLCVLRLELPPLRARRDDILPLAFHFLRKHARSREPVTSLTPEAQGLLYRADWPGNIRQLENTIVRAAHLCRSSSIDVEDLELPAASMPLGASPAGVPLAPLRMLKRQTIESFERSYLTDLMRECHGNVTHAARLAGKERRDLGRLLKKYRIDVRADAG